MTDNLRDRIAAAIDQKYNEEAIGHTYEVCLHAADAVIEALGLKITVDFLSADWQRRNWMVAGHCMMEAPRA